MKSTTISITLAVIATGIAIYAAVTVNQQTQEINALNDAIFSLEHGAEEPDESLDASAQVDQFNHRLSAIETEVGSQSSALTATNSAWLSTGETAKDNARAIAALQRETASLATRTVSRIGANNDVEELRTELYSLANCVELNVSAVNQWSAYPTAGGFYGYTCNIGR